MDIKWGNVPLPEGHITAIVGGIALHIPFPLIIFKKPWIGHTVGWPIVTLGILLAGWAVIATKTVDIESPTTLITSGPYAYSRNPMYVAWTALVLGTGLIINTMWLMLFLPVVVLYTHFAVILREEELLEQQHGEAYRQYCRTVRRYLQTGTPSRAE